MHSKIKKLFIALNFVTLLALSTYTQSASAGAANVRALTCKESYANGDTSISCVEPRFPYLGQYRRLSSYSDAKSLCKLLGYSGDSAYTITGYSESSNELLVSVMKVKKMAPIEHFSYVKTLTCK